MKSHVKILFAALAASLLLSSCGQSQPQQETTAAASEATQTTAVDTSASATSSATATQAAEVIEPELDLDPYTIRIIYEGETSFSVVLPAGSLTKQGGKGVQKDPNSAKMSKLSTEVDTAVVTSTVSLISALAEKTGVTLPLTDDGATPAANAAEYEILIGLTDREESIALHQKLKPRSFAVQSTDKKLVIVGYDDNMTAVAVRYCVENYVLGSMLAGQIIDEGLFTMPVHTEAISPQYPEAPEHTIQIGGQYTLKTATVLTEIAKDGNYKVMQGAATDGTYLYYCIENQALEAHESYIYKVDIATGKIVKRSKSLQLDHSNDMTYNPKLNQLVVVHNAPHRELVSFVDIETLEKVKTIDIGREIFCMAYNEMRDQYVVGLSGGQTFAVLNSDFGYLREYTPVASTGYTTQGMTCDDNYLYFAQSGANVVVVYDWDGYQVAVIPIEFTNIETENICIVGNYMYIGFYRSGNGGIVYRTQLTVKK